MYYYLSQKYLAYQISRKEDETMRSAKYILLVTLILFTFTSATGLAAASRYEGIVMEDAVVAQIDKDTLRYEKDPYRSEKLLSVWIKTTSDYSSDFTLHHYLFRLSNREMLLLDTVEYNGAGQVNSRISNPYNPSSWTMILPETALEKCYISALKYSQTNDAQLQQDYNERTTPKQNDSFILADIFNIFYNNN